MTEARLIWDAKAPLGEGPLWSARDNAVYWTDIKGHKLRRYHLADGGTNQWQMPEDICWVIERRHKPGFIAGFRTSVAELTLDPLIITPRFAPESNFPNNRLNDAKADGQGRIWFGSMNEITGSERADSGNLYRLDPDFGVHCVDTGYFCANGPTLSRDGRVIYHTDSAKRRIYCFDVAADGSLSNKRAFAEFSEADGYPDGMTTDVEGCLWVAHWEGWGITRFRPNGSRDRFISLPVSQVTSCCFAGPKLDRLFVTSARIGLLPQQLDKEPLAGGLFEVTPGVAGLPTEPFAG
jgi:xylono-1,5-lactonase